jgi:hypothetical protein
MDLEKCGAHHESGHIVVAAVQGLRLRPEGIMVDSCGWGLACYNKEPEDTTDSIERVIVTSLAGLAAERRIREECSYPQRDELDKIFGDDARTSRILLGRLVGDYYANECRLEMRLNGLIESHWRAIKALAAVLQAKGVERIKPLKSGDSWSSPGQTTAKYVEGVEVVRVLSGYGIDAVCETEL